MLLIERPVEGRACLPAKAGIYGTPNTKFNQWDSNTPCALMGRIPETVSGSTAT
jgi:hypothetical protein